MLGIKQCIGKAHDIRRRFYIFFIPVLNSTFAVLLLSLVKILGYPESFFRLLRK